MLKSTRKLHRKTLCHQFSITPKLGSDIILYGPVSCGFVMNLKQRCSGPRAFLFTINRYKCSLVFIQQHAVEDGERLHRVSQFAHHQVDAHRVLSLQRQNDAEDSQRARVNFSLGHGVVLQALRLIASRVHAGHAVVRLRQDCLDLFVPVTCQDGAEVVISIYRCSEDTCREPVHSILKQRSTRKCMH